MYPSKIRYDANQLEQLLVSRINNLINGFNAEQVILEKTKEGSVLSKDFILKFKFIKRDREIYFVNSFWEIGMTDPFPNDEDLIIGSVDDIPEDFKMPTQPKDLVYPY